MFRGLITKLGSGPARLGRSHARVVLGAGAAACALCAVTLMPSSPSNGAMAAVAHVAPASHAITAAEQSLPQPEKPQSSSERFTGRVGSDLSASLINAGVPEAQAREYVGLLARTFPLASGLSVDDKFDLILLRQPDGSLGQLVYAGMDRVARADVELMKWTDGKHVIWVNADSTGGADEASGGFRMPVAGRITSGFGERYHPILGYERFHAGVDLGAAAGTPIVAAADGRVVSAGWAGGYGRAVSIAHSGGIETRYGHMSRIAAFAGEQVHRGEVIGYVGSSGLSTGPHLHFEVMKNGRPVNPLSVKTISGAPAIDGAKLLAVHDELRQILLNSSTTS
jgi:murein DD-endopeptidase MepM/ murein hydrolase activator NlpD